MVVYYYYYETLLRSDSLTVGCFQRNGRKFILNLWMMEVMSYASLQAVPRYRHLRRLSGTELSISHDLPMYSVVFEEKSWAGSMLAEERIQASTKSRSYELIVSRRAMRHALAPFDIQSQQRRSLS